MNKNERYQLQFYFPTVAKEIGQVQQVKVEPLWEHVSATHIVGLFRIIVRVTFTNHALSVLQRDNAIAIEQIDIQGQEGYFEYAWPFEWHFEQPLEQFSLKVHNVATKTLHTQICQITWQVGASWHSDSSSFEYLPVSAEKQEVKQESLPQPEAVSAEPPPKQYPEVVSAGPPPKQYSEAVSAGPPPKQYSEAVSAEPPPKQYSEAVSVEPEKTVAVKQPPKKESNIFMNDLVEQYSIWRSNDLRPKQERYNDKE